MLHPLNFGESRHSTNCPFLIIASKFLELKEEQNQIFDKVGEQVEEVGDCKISGMSILKTSSIKYK